MFRSRRAAGRHDLLIDAAHRHLRAIGLPPDEVPSSAHAEVDLADQHGYSFRTEHPAGKMLGVGPGLEDELARRVEGTRHDDFQIRGRSELQGCVVHLNSPLSSLGGFYVSSVGGCWVYNSSSKASRRWKFPSQSSGDNPPATRLPRREAVLRFGTALRSGNRGRARSALHAPAPSQVFGDCGLRHSKRACQLASTEASLRRCEPGENRAPGTDHASAAKARIQVIGGLRCT